MKMKYQLRCVAPDGEYVTEGQFETVEAAWNRASDMGSRWFFYPVCVITGTGKKARIVDTPHELRPFKGRQLSTLQAWFAHDPQMVCEWVNGEAPFLSPFPYETV